MWLGYTISVLVANSHSCHQSLAQELPCAAGVALKNSVSYLEVSANLVMI